MINLSACDTESESTVVISVTDLVYKLTSYAA